MFVASFQHGALAMWKLFVVLLACSAGVLLRKATYFYVAYWEQQLLDEFCRDWDEEKREGDFSFPSPSPSSLAFLTHPLSSNLFLSQFSSSIKIQGGATIFISLSDKGHEAGNKITFVFELSLYFGFSWFETMIVTVF